MNKKNGWPIWPIWLIHAGRDGSSSSSSSALTLSPNIDFCSAPTQQQAPVHPSTHPAIQPSSHPAIQPSIHPSTAHVKRRVRGGGQAEGRDPGTHPWTKSQRFPFLRVRECTSARRKQRAAPRRSTCRHIPSAPPAWNVSNCNVCSPAGLFLACLLRVVLLSVCVWWMMYQAGGSCGWTAGTESEPARHPALSSSWCCG